MCFRVEVDTIDGYQGREMDLLFKVCWKLAENEYNNYQSQLYAPQSNTHIYTFACFNLPQVVLLCTSKSF